MSVAWPWLLVGLLVPILAVALWRLWRPAKRPPQFIGDTSSATGLPSYTRELRRGKRLAWGEVGVIALLITTLSLIAARPQQQIRKIDTQHARDIVLCMDVSGSMGEFILPALKTLKKTVEANPTDRYALVLFGNVPYVALPLTSDTVATQLVLDSLVAGYDSSTTNATFTLGFSPSAEDGTDVAEGVASCFRRFDSIDQERSRHIILVSDMEHTTSTNQAAVATLLPKYGVKLYVLAPTFSVAKAQQNPIIQITGAPIEELNFDGSNAEETLTALYNTILSARQTETYVLVDVPFIWWGVATGLTAVWAAIVTVRWRRQ